MFIFVVDDDLEVAEVVGESLQDNGYEVAIFQNGLEAVRYLNTRVPELIITDIEMPEMDGLALRSHVLSLYPTCKFILMTGGDSQVDGVVRKPVRLKFLLSNVKQLLAANP